ncbi:unnamed protein product [Victoria cruziana]
MPIFRSISRKHHLQGKVRGEVLATAGGVEAYQEAFNQHQVNYILKEISGQAFAAEDEIGEAVTSIDGLNYQVWKEI